MFWKGCIEPHFAFSGLAQYGCCSVFFMLCLVVSGYLMSLNNRDSRYVGDYVVISFMTNNVEKRQVNLIDVSWCPAMEFEKYCVK